MHAHLEWHSARLRKAKLTSCCASYASCAPARGAAVGALGSQTPVVAYRIPGTQVALHIVVGFVEEPVYVRSCGAEKGSLLLLLPTPVRSLYTQVTAQKA